MDKFTKDPSAVLDYIFDWSRWLEPNDAIASATFAVDDSSLVVHSSAHDIQTATVWLTGGTMWETYKVTCSIETTQGRTDQRSMLITLKDR